MDEGWIGFLFWSWHAFFCFPSTIRSVIDSGWFIEWVASIVFKLSLSCKMACRTMWLSTSSAGPHPSRGATQSGASVQEEKTQNGWEELFAANNEMIRWHSTYFHVIPHNSWILPSSVIYCGLWYGSYVCVPQLLAKLQRIETLAKILPKRNISSFNCICCAVWCAANSQRFIWWLESGQCFFREKNDFPTTCLSVSYPLQCKRIG